VGHFRKTKGGNKPLPLRTTTCCCSVPPFGLGEPYRIRGKKRTGKGALVRGGACGVLGQTMEKYMCELGMVERRGVELN